MSRINQAIRLLAKAVGTTIQRPHDAAKALGSLPSVVQGEQFSRKTAFSSHVPSEDDSVDTANPLLAYFDAHTHGPGIWKWIHYFDIYQRHFSRFVGREVHVLEVGIYSGGSLSMWKEYFGTGCHMYGVDIEESCRTYSDDRTKVFIGDQADRSFWRRVKQEVPIIDILIDDGGHHPEQQRITLEEMLSHLHPGGVYLCEDIHGASNPFAAYLQGLAGSLHTFASSAMPNGVPGTASTPSNFQQAIHSIHLYPFVGVIETREKSIRRFIAPKRGTQWQPFL